MLEPVAVLETFFRVVAGRIAVMGFDEGLLLPDISLATARLEE